MITWHAVNRDKHYLRLGSKSLFKSIENLEDPCSGRVVYYSYGTPILVWLPSSSAAMRNAGFGRWLQNPTKYSRTTTRHLYLSLKDAGYPLGVEIPTTEAEFRAAAFGGKFDGGGLNPRLGVWLSK